MPDAEIIVVDDGSTDKTVDICLQNNIIVHSHPYSMGNGAAVKTGTRLSNGETLIFMDADGQHNPEEIKTLLQTLDNGFDMAVGARNGQSHTSFGRRAANAFYNVLSSWIVGNKIKDLTSGFRAVRAGKFREFLYLLPNGFSYPSTITMAFFRAGYPVSYVPIDVKPAARKSHLSPLRDGIRFLLIIFRIGTLYSPLKVFVPISLVFFLVGLFYYFYTYITMDRFTNMSGLLFTTSVVIFLIGLVSEQITNLLYSYSNNTPKKR